MHFSSPHLFITFLINLFQKVKNPLPSSSFSSSLSVSYGSLCKYSPPFPLFFQLLLSLVISVVYISSVFEAFFIQKQWPTPPNPRVWRLGQGQRLADHSVFRERSSSRFDSLQFLLWRKRPLPSSFRLVLRRSEETSAPRHRNRRAQGLHISLSLSKNSESLDL